MIFFAVGQRLDQLVGEVDRVGVQDANPVDAVDLVQLAEQLGQARPAVEVEAVVGRVLGDDDQLADAVGGQLAGLGHAPSSIGLVTCLPRMPGIAQKVQSRSQPSEIFR